MADREEVPIPAKVRRFNARASVPVDNRMGSGLFALQRIRADQLAKEQAEVNEVQEINLGGEGVASTGREAHLGNNEEFSGDHESSSNNPSIGDERNPEFSQTAKSSVAPAAGGDVSDPNQLDRADSDAYRGDDELSATATTHVSGQEEHDADESRVVGDGTGINSSASQNLDRQELSDEYDNI